MAGLNVAQLLPALNGGGGARHRRGRRGTGVRRGHRSGDFRRRATGSRTGGARAANIWPGPEMPALLTLRWCGSTSLAGRTAYRYFACPLAVAGLDRLASLAGHGSGDPAPVRHHRSCTCTSGVPLQRLTPTGVERVIAVQKPGVTICTAIIELPAARIQVIPRGVNLGSISYGYQLSAAWQADWRRVSPARCGRC